MPRTKEQQKAYARSYYLANREKIIARSSAYHKDHRTRSNARQRESYRRTQKWKLIPGWTKELYDECLDGQKGLCAICLKQMFKPVRDHNHKNNRARMLLCDPCNRMLGAASEDVNTFHRAIEYLLAFNTD